MIYHIKLLLTIITTAVSTSLKRLKINPWLKAFTSRTKDLYQWLPCKPIPAC